MNRRVKTKGTTKGTSERRQPRKEEPSLIGFPIDWYEVQARVRPYIVRIETQHGSGTGFLFGYNADRSVAAIATAAHVVQEAHDWGLAIKLIHDDSEEEALLTQDDVSILLDSENDSASLLVDPDVLPFPEEVLPLIPEDHLLPVGTELGWMGYPSVDRENLLCFFTGRVSAFSHLFDYYQVDGVAIDGVSGGPAFTPIDDCTPGIAGVISSYAPNVTAKGTLPGLLQAHNISSFHEMLKTIRTVDEAQKREAEAAKGKSSRRTNVK